MCGIAGFLSLSFNSTSADHIIRKMTDAIAHRGPDASGSWLDADAGIALGHRRLTILDLSPEGNQPMVSVSGRFVVVFNGEIYNYRALRKELEDTNAVTVSWRGHSDTEVMLAAIEAWGVKKAVQACVGMFAIALWDRQERMLHLIRDRIGEKPLFYGWSGNTLLFGSELKAFKAHPEFQAIINCDALALLMRHNYIPAPHCIYKGFYKLEPGMILTFPTVRTTPGITPDPTPYWQARTIAEQGIYQPFIGSEQDAISRLAQLLHAAVAGQMVADVPLGAFLSGGIDSSIIVALMQAQSTTPVKTFTIGFNEAEHNEAVYAKAVAGHLGTDHTDLYVTSEDALAVIPKLPALYDEPFADSSQIPTYLVSHLARRSVTVSLSGDAGDELFGGYMRYLLAKKIWSSLRWLPYQGRRALAHVVNSAPTHLLDVGFGWLAPVWKKYGNDGKASNKLRKLAQVFAVDSFGALYLQLVSNSRVPTDLVMNAQEPKTFLNDLACHENIADLQQKMMFLDMVSYLPDDILVKVDRAAMGVSLETRIPLLDHRVVEFAWQLPLSMKIREGQGKWILRQLLLKYVPRELIDRPKMGFAVPVDQWLRGPLRPWAEELLDEKRLQSEGFFRVKPIRKMWAEHLAGTSNWHSYLWDVLMFQAWIEHN